MDTRVAVFSETNYELASRSLVDYVVEAAGRVSDETPVVLRGEDISEQWSALLAETKASRILFLEESRPFLQAGTLKAFCEEGDGARFLKDDEDSVAAAVIDKGALGEFKIDPPSFDGVIGSMRQSGEIESTSCDSQEAAAIGNSVELARAEAAMQAQLRQRALEAGACLQNPDSVIFSFDTVLESGAIVEPNVVFAPGVQVAQGARICAFSYLEGANVGALAIVGPYARVRPNTNIGERVYIGNFVEVKQSKIDEDSKIPHLSYIGDANIGKRVNLGAGTITCNFDGVQKHETDIKDDAFVGSNTSLIAPLYIGKRAIVGAGSTITDDVGDFTLSVARAYQSNHRRRKTEDS